MFLNNKLIQNDQDLSLILLCKDFQQFEDYFFDDFQWLGQKFLRWLNFFFNSRAAIDIFFFGKKLIFFIKEKIINGKIF